ncbi:hypothetical protein CBR_g2872 [Chara braunii]|uniref:Uncharacterized protein n=1 Tax=Chara braunii TaxID=69332 RepID=A0A388KE44_CHABU|nr:hypothetical protein CBR_g2872 [Chara braunii]|eukprot:GBG68328.1 hypothetical protein CBR_g2872 [Chara braunii]
MVARLRGNDEVVLMVTRHQVDGDTSSVGWLMVTRDGEDNESQSKGNGDTSSERRDKSEDRVFGRRGDVSGDMVTCHEEQQVGW